jgi:Peptidase family M1 domain
MMNSRFVWTLTLVALCAAAPSLQAGVPDWLPRYAVAFDLDVANGQLAGHMQATWTNCYRRPVRELVFNAHSHYVVPSSEIGFDAKMLEILRMDAGEVLGVDKPPFELHTVTLPGDKPIDLPFRFEGDTNTNLVVPLPFELQPGQAVTVDLTFTFHIPKKQGRWGCWENITTLSNWLPVFAVFDDAKLEEPLELGTGNSECGTKTEVRTPSSQFRVPSSGGPVSQCWQPTPFVPWHQPFFNEACIYRVRARLPSNQQVACTGAIVARKDLGDGRQQVDIEADGVRDFAFLCSERYVSHDGVIAAQPGVPAPIKVHVLAYAEHEFYAKEFVRIASEAIIAYSRWFGPYPYPEFTVAESYFGWNGNECGTLVMIDQRVFAMPHLAVSYVDYLLSHEVCHQWWYNQVGTNGYCETWMDEALATFFSNELENEKHGRNNQLIAYPAGLEWAPNIRRDDYRSYSLYGTIGRGENSPVVQEIPKFGHLGNLFSMCYDKGSRIVGMIEARLGEESFRSFMRVIFKKYQYRILRVADYQRELEAFTGDANGDWNRFFKEWLYGTGLCDWAVEKVEVHDRVSALCPSWLPRRPLHAFRRKCNDPAYPVRVTVQLKQCGENTERTWLGFSMPGCEGYPIRVPIVPGADPYHIDEPPCDVISTGKNEVRVEIQLPFEPEQIAVDPDQILVDTNPANNFWRPHLRWRLTPIYTFLEETDLTNAYDRWNVIAGPWIYGTAYNDAWYTRSTMFGARAGLYRTQDFDGGAYVAYRTDFQDVVAGVDGLWDHWPYSHTQIGFNLEKRLAETEAGENEAFRAAAFARYVFMPSDSLYLLPAHFVEAFTAYQDNFFPYARNTTPDSVRFEHASTVGLHYCIDYRLPYWNPEGGFLFDTVYQTGIAELNGAEHGIHEFSAQGSIVKSLPDLTGCFDWSPALRDTLHPLLQWFGDTRLAMRLYGATGLPSQGLFFTLGGPDMFRGFDLADRQGSTVWVGSVEWRMPLARGLTYDCFDHIMGLRNVWGAVFYDIGNAYTSDHEVGPVAQAIGGGLRLDVSWFSFVERTTLRFDVAKTVNADTPLQFWVGVGYPF